MKNTHEHSVSNRGLTIILASIVFFSGVLGAVTFHQRLLATAGAVVATAIVVAFVFRTAKYSE